MKEYLLIYFCVMAITGPVKSSSLEYENSQNLPANLYNNLPNIAREGNSNNLNQLNSENNNLLRNANNYYHLNHENNNLQRSNLLRKRNYLNLYNSEHYNLGRQGAPSPVNPAEPSVADLKNRSAAIEKYLKNSNRDLDVATLQPQTESRFGSYGGGGGVGGGISGGIGISAGIGGHIGAGAGGYGYGYGGGYPYYG